MCILSPHRSLVDRTVHLSISASKPTETIPLIEKSQTVLKLSIGEVLGADEIVEHFARIDER